jgi:hypothetical protein
MGYSPPGIRPDDRTHSRNVGGLTFDERPQLPLPLTPPHFKLRNMKSFLKRVCESQQVSCLVSFSTLKGKVNREPIPCIFMIDMTYSMLGSVLCLIANNIFAVACKRNALSTSCCFLRLMKAPFKADTSTMRSKVQ